jgi:hypothetical protein
MKPPARLSRGRIVAAYAIAVVCDVAQLPVNLMYLTGALTLPGQALDLVIDAAAFVATTLLIGFHWTLLPTAVLEAVPFADALPSWTVCVAFVVARRKQAERATAVDVRQISR